MHRSSPFLAVLPVLGISALLLAGCAPGQQRQVRLSEERTTQATIRYTSATESIRVGDLDGALRKLAEAIEINPEYTAAYMGMADIYRMDRQYDLAAQHYAAAAQIEPQNRDANFYHGLMLHLLDRVTDAIQAYLRVLSIDEDDFAANLNLSTAYYQLDESRQALIYGRRAVRINPNDGPARFNLGVIFASLDRHREAINEYQQAMELMDLEPQLLLNLAESLSREQRYEEMRNTLERVSELTASAAVLERLGFARYRLNDFDGAQQAFEQSLALEGDYYPALNGLGVCFLNKWYTSDKKDWDSHQRGVDLLRRSLLIKRNQPRIVDILSRYGG